MMKEIREKLNGPLLAPRWKLFDLVERVRYAGPDQRIPHLPIGTAQIIDTVECFMLRVLQDNIPARRPGRCLTGPYQLDSSRCFDSDVVAPEALKEFASTLTSLRQGYRRELLEHCCGRDTLR